MATQKSPKKETTKKEKKEIKWIQSIHSTIKNETVQFVTGLLCVMVALYMILAFSSFILNGGADQSAMEQQSITEQIANPYTEEVQNATGRSGAQDQRLRPGPFCLVGALVAAGVGVEVGAGVAVTGTGVSAGNASPDCAAASRLSSLA